MKKLFLLYRRAAYESIRLLVKLLQKPLSNVWACRLQNFFLACHGRGTRFYFDRDSSLFCAVDQGSFVYFGAKDRGFSFYSLGIKERGTKLAESYCLMSIDFKKDDVVIDCGANYADLFIFLSDKIMQTNYVAVEPGPVEYACIRRSVPMASCHRVAFADKPGVREFFLSSGTGDSSLIEPVSFQERVEVEVETLDRFAKTHEITRCKLLKIEAEGSEPEVLFGAHGFLRYCEYVAVDGGPERGTTADVTFHLVNNYLLKNGFEMIDCYGPSYRALYRNRVPIHSPVALM